MCVHMCSCVCTCVHVCVHICSCVHMCSCVCAHVFMCVYVCMCVCTCVCVCMCICVCAHVCMCVHTCSCVCMCVCAHVFMCVHVCVCTCVCGLAIMSLTLGHPHSSYVHITPAIPGASLEVMAYLDPLSSQVQRIVPLLHTLHSVLAVDIHLYLNPQHKLSELPIKRQVISQLTDHVTYVR